MTREEAITILIRQIDDDPFIRTEYRKQVHEALNMAIEALEQQYSDDCINRQAMLEIQIKYAEHMGATKFWQMRDEIKSLPSVTPQQKVGRWIKHGTGHNIYYDCSRCNCIASHTETVGKRLWKLSNYCPDCGAKMKEVGE